MTSDNPYRPPAALASEVASAPSAPRPLSLWFFMALLALLGSMTLLGVVRLSLIAIGGERPGVSMSVLGVSLLVRAAVSAVCATTLVGLWTRRSWARALALATLAAMLLCCELLPDTTVYGSDSARAGGRLMQEAVAPGLCLWWVWVLGASAKGRRYFGLQPVKALQQLPAEPRR